MAKKERTFSINELAKAWSADLKREVTTADVKRALGPELVSLHASNETLVSLAQANRAYKALISEAQEPVAEAKAADGEPVEGVSKSDLVIWFSRVKPYLGHEEVRQAVLVVAQRLNFEIDPEQPIREIASEVANQAFKSGKSDLGERTSIMPEELPNLSQLSPRPKTREEMVQEVAEFQEGVEAKKKARAESGRKPTPKPQVEPRPQPAPEPESQTEFLTVAEAYQELENFNQIAKTSQSSGKKRWASAMVRIIALALGLNKDGSAWAVYQRVKDHLDELIRTKGSRHLTLVHRDPEKRPKLPPRESKGTTPQTKPQAKPKSTPEPSQALSPALTRMVENAIHDLLEPYFEQFRVAVRRSEESEAGAKKHAEEAKRHAVDAQKFASAAGGFKREADQRAGMAFEHAERAKASAKEAAQQAQSSAMQALGRMVELGGGMLTSPQPEGHALFRREAMAWLEENSDNEELLRLAAGQQGWEFSIAAMPGEIYDRLKDHVLSDDYESSPIDPSNFQAVPEWLRDADVDEAFQEESAGDLDELPEWLQEEGEEALEVTLEEAPADAVPGWISDIGAPPEEEDTREVVISGKPIHPPEQRAERPGPPLYELGDQVIAYHPQKDGVRELVKVVEILEGRRLRIRFADGTQTAVRELEVDPWFPGKKPVSSQGRRSTGQSPKPEAEGQRPEAKGEEGGLKGGAKRALSWLTEEM
jgi:hypothetical protein